MIDSSSYFRISNLKLWTLFFIYTLLAGLLIQLILLPYVFPTMHAGGGLLLGGDWVGFNRLAIELADKIHAQGWSAWELKPDGQPVAGIASIFYFLIAPKPWSILPLNAALHATAALALYQTIYLLLKNQKISLFVTIPFLLFPSSLTWTAQMHNDSYAIAGQLLFFLGWVMLSRLETYSSLRSVSFAVIAILSGILLVWLVRIFLVQILHSITLPIAVLLTIQFVIMVFRSKVSWPKAIFAVTIVWALVFVLGLRSSPQRVVRAEATANRVGYAWASEWWLPSIVDRQLKALSITRNTNVRVMGHGASSIDLDVEFHGAMDIVLYIPRALQIGFLAPFPSDWFGSGSSARTTLERRVSGIEMSFAYLAFLGLPIAFWHLRKYLGFYVLLLYATGMLMVYTLVITNLGTLYRFRYGYFMIFVALGVAGWYIFLEPRLARIRRK